MACNVLSEDQDLPWIRHGNHLASSKTLLEAAPVRRPYYNIGACLELIHVL